MSDEKVIQVLLDSGGWGTFSMFALTSEGRIFTCAVGKHGIIVDWGEIRGPLDATEEPTDA